MDALAWFDIPKEHTVDVSSGATKLCGFEPRRVALILCAVVSSGTVQVSTNPAVSLSLGYTLSVQNPALQLFNYESGPLCQQAWFGNGQLGALMTVIEVLVRDWPDDYIPDGG